MFEIKHYPIRFEKAHKRYSFDPLQKTLRAHVRKVIGVDVEGLDVICDGKAFDPDQIPEDGKEYILTPKIKGRKFWSTFYDPLGFGYGRAIFGAPSALVNINPPPKIPGGFVQPSYGSATSDGMEGSPTYGWEGIKTTQDVGIPIKIVYGRHRTGGNIINQFVSTDGDKQYLNLLIALCEGEIQSLSNVLVNGNPIENFSGITSEQRTGTNAQTVIPNFEDLHNLYPVGANLTKDNPYVYTTADSDVEAFEIYLTMPGGLYQVSGGLTSWQVSYRVEYRVNGTTPWTDLGITTIDEKTRSTVRRIFRKEGLAKHKYDIRITRTSENSQLDPQKQGDLTLQQIDEIKTDDLAYPNTALYSVKALATDQLSGSTPNLTFLIEGKKVRIPNVLTALGGSAVAWEDYYYDPAASQFKKFSDNSVLYWDGTTYVSAWSANPIWCLRDLQLNDIYGMGDFIETDNIDDAKLLEMALICEEKVSDGEGGFEKRFRLDVVLDSLTKVPDLINQLAASFRAFSFYSQNGFTFSIDRAEDPVQIFGMGNIIKNSFQQSWKSRNDFFNMIEIQYLDEDIDYEQELIGIMDEESVEAGDPIRKKQVKLYTTKKSYALREGKYALAASKYINRTIEIKCGIDALACQAGDRIDVSHDIPEWGESGRLKEGSTSTVLKLDKEVYLEEGYSYRISIRFADDTIEERAIITASGYHSSITVGSAFSSAPAAYSVFIVGIETTVSKPFRVIAISRQSNGEVGISAIEYNESIYSDSGIAVPTNNYSSLSHAIPNVQSLRITERLIKLSDGTIESAIDVWFTRPDVTHIGLYSKAKIYLSDNGGLSWIYKGETQGESFGIFGDLQDGTEYKIAVISADYMGKGNAIETSPQQTINLLGKMAPPSDVGGFIVIQSRDRLFFGWKEVPDVDLSGYEIRYGESWDSGYVLETGIKASNLLRVDMRVGANQSYWIKAIDTSGNYSQTATEAVISIDAIPFTNIIVAYEEEASWGGTLDHIAVVSSVLQLTTGSLTGKYTTAQIDCGYVASFKVGLSAVVTASAGSETWDQEPALATWAELSETERWSGSEVAGAASYRIRTSLDGITWGAWADWNAGDYKCRYFQLELTLTRQDTGTGLECSEFHYYSDLPDVDEFGEGEVTVAASGVSVLFSKTFHDVPAVAITILSGSGRVPVFTAEPDLTDFTVKLYDLSGVAQTGRFSYHAHGV